jgi:spore maturation protein CgeB
VTIALGHEFDRMFVEAFQELGWAAASVPFYHRGSRPGWRNYLSRPLAMLAGEAATFEREKRRCVTRLERMILEQQPDLLLCVRGEWIDRAVVERVRAIRPGIKIAVWMYDPVRLYPQGLDGAGAADCFYLYDEDDVSHYVSTRGAPATRLDLGYSTRRFFPLPDRAPTVDVSMTGTFGLSSYDRRLSIADRLVRLSRARGFSLRIVGPMWKDWTPMASATRRAVASRWPAFVAAFENRTLSYPEQNELYNTSRVNINAHRDESDGSCNTRVFEICGAGGFQLCDENPIVGEVLEKGKEIELFGDESELEEKVLYYLAHPERRATIAAAGLAAARTRHQLVDRVARIVSNACDERPVAAVQPERVQVARAMSGR